MDYFEAFKWRWSHTHHHSRTIHLNIDYEIQDLDQQTYGTFLLQMLLLLKEYGQNSNQSLAFTWNYDTNC